MTNQLALTNGKPGSDVLGMIANNPKLQPTTKAQYSKAVTNYLAAGHNLGDPATLQTYAADLPKSSRSFLKAAVRLWTNHIATQTKAEATPDNVAAVTATLYRLDAVNEAIKVEGSKGDKAHQWLSQAEVKKLLETTNQRTPKGRRDRVALGLLVGAGLRREELVQLTFEEVVLQPVGNRFRTVLNIKGKGAKDRVIPISDKLAAALDQWQKVCGSGNVARSVTRGGMLKDSISAIGIFGIVAAAGDAIGKPTLAPHDLRRTYAQLGFEAGIAITQISKLLGHASIATTQRYLNLDLDLETTISDFVPFE